MNTKEYWEEATPMNFTDEKWSYEKKRAFRYELQDYMHEAFRFDEWKGKKVLEVGCGSGIDAIEFARNGAIVHAVDITENACNLTDELAIEAGVSVKVLQRMQNTLPYPDETFDLVYSYGVLHHISFVEDTLFEIRRVLKPGGTVMAMLYNKDSLLYAYSIQWLHRFDDLSEKVRTAMYSERNEGCPYTKAYTKIEARELFEHWFTNVSIDVRYNVVDLPTQRKVKLGISDDWELGWHLIVKGRK